MPRGGKREGSGRKTGKKMLDKIAAREELRRQVIKHMGPLIHAQIANAAGIAYLVVREKASGKFLRVGQGRAEKLNPAEEIIEIWEKDPSVQAFADLMNRALDKPVEQVEVGNPGEFESIEARILATRKKIAAERAQGASV